MLKTILAISAIVSAVRLATKSASGKFEIDIVVDWDTQCANVTIKDGPAVVLSSPVCMGGNSADAFGKQYSGHVVRLTRNRTKNIYLIEIYFDNKLLGGNIIDFNNRKVIKIT